MNGKKAKRLRKEVRMLATNDPRIIVQTTYKAVKKLYTEGKIKITDDPTTEKAIQ